MKYFAYEADMFTPHLRRCIPKANVIGVGYIQGYKFSFHRYDEDGCGKGNISHVRDHCTVYGVIYDIEPRYRHILDMAHYLGYGCQEINVKAQTHSSDEQP